MRKGEAKQRRVKERSEFAVPAELSVPDSTRHNERVKEKVRAKQLIEISRMKFIVPSCILYLLPEVSY